MVDAISRGSFVPDGPRSSFFRQAPIALDEAASRDVKAEPSGDEQHGPGQDCDPVEIVVTDDSSSDDGDDDVASTDEEMPARVVPKVKRFRARIPPSESWFSHRK